MVSFMSMTPLFFWSICEASTTRRCSLSSDNEPATGQTFERAQICVHVVSREIKMTGRYSPLSMSSIKRAGVPTPMPIFLFCSKATCSSTFMCFANCDNSCEHKNTLEHVKSQLTSFATRLSLPENFLRALQLHMSVSCPRTVRSAKDSYLVRSAALKPAPATTMVWGMPFFFCALARLSGCSENFSRNSGSFSSDLFSCHEVVSVIEDATNLI